METPSRQIADPAVPETCIGAGAVVAERDGHTIVANYGSVPAEIAVCMKSVGLADRSDYGALELRGDQALLDIALTARLGDPPPVPGTARRLRSVWYIRLEQRRALLVGSRAALASEPPISKGRDRSDLSQRDIDRKVAILSIIGPRAARLLAAAELSGELAIGGVARDPGDSDVLAILRESQRRFLMLVRAPAADAFWARLLAAGEPLGAAFVGLDALTLLGVSSGARP